MKSQSRERAPETMRSGLVPGAALGEHGLAGPADEERPEQRLGRLVEEQIAVEFEIAGQKVVEDEPDDRPGLAGLLKGRRTAAEVFEPRADDLAERLPGGPVGVRFVLGLVRVDEPKQVIYAAEKPNILST